MSEKTALDTEDTSGVISDQQLMRGNDNWHGVDLATVPIPDEKDRPKYEWETEERQAEILRLVRQYGHPERVYENVGTQSEIGETFGVSQSQISYDVGRVREYIATHVGKRALSKTDLIINSGVRELQAEDPYKAGKLQLEYMEFLMDVGAIDREPDRKEVASINVSGESGLTDEQREQFDRFAEMMTGGDDDGEEEPITVESSDED